MLLPMTSSGQILFGSSVSIAFFGLLLHFKPSIAKVNVAEKELHWLQIVQHASIILQLQIGIALYNRQTAQELGRDTGDDDEALGAVLIALILAVVVVTFCKLRGDTRTDSLVQTFSLSHARSFSASVSVSVSLSLCLCLSSSHIHTHTHTHTHTSPHTHTDVLYRFLAVAKQHSIGKSVEAIAPASRSGSRLSLLRRHKHGPQKDPHITETFVEALKREARELKGRERLWRWQCFVYPHLAFSSSD